MTQFKTDISSQMAPTDREFLIFARDLSNHSMHFGTTALVRKLGRGWITQFRGHGHPVVFKTKGEAVKMAAEWVREVSRRRYELLQEGHA
jgi:hypothetical protein